MAGMLAVLVILCGAGCSAAMGSSAARIPPQRLTAKSKTRPRPKARETPKARPRAVTPPRPRAVTPPRPSAVSPQQDLTVALAPLIRDDGGHFAVAVDDLSTGGQAAYAGGQEFVTASIVKVDILVTLLYQAQQADQALSAGEQELAATMIEYSDNDSASDLYYDVGGAGAVDAANRVCGLTETTVGTEGYWGLTTTTVDDQIRLLRVAFTRPSPLSPASQDYIQTLMSQVETDQQWGIPAAADPGSQFTVKNGWLPNPVLWEINSIGEITHRGQRMLIAVLSDDNASEDSGISLVEAAAMQAAGAMASS
jgi:beta-lactamase class A